MAITQQCRDVYVALQPWGREPGSQFRAGAGLEEALAAARQILPTHSDMRSVSMGAGQAINSAANYGQNFKPTQCAEWLGYPHNNRELRRQRRALGISEQQHTDMFVNVMAAASYIEFFGETERKWIQLWDWDVPEMWAGAVTVLVLRLRLTALGKMPYPSFTD